MVDLSLSKDRQFLYLRSAQSSAASLLLLVIKESGKENTVRCREPGQQADMFCSARTQRGKEEWQRAAVTPPHHTAGMKHSPSNSGP